MPTHVLLAFLHMLARHRSKLGPLPPDFSDFDHARAGFDQTWDDVDQSRQSTNLGCVASCGVALNAAVAVLSPCIQRPIRVSETPTYVGRGVVAAISRAPTTLLAWYGNLPML